MMNAFYDGQYDVLLSTTIVESGLDIPTANTLIVHRADMFGLAQLYQLRGRVGRSKLRAYALFTLPANRKLTDTAERRLKVLQSLDTLGAGFQLASHDLDIRGAGNLLGEEQSGHIKEVGFELYQQMLEEAVAEPARPAATRSPTSGWSPQITIGTAVMIPEGYVPDLQLRWRSTAASPTSTTREEIDAFGAELIDRFGPLPEEVEHLLKIVSIKALCRQANVEKVDAGPKGVVIHFRNNEFADPAGAGALDRRAGIAGEDPAGPERRLHPRLADAGEAAAGRGRGHDAAGAAGGRRLRHRRSGCGVMRSLAQPYRGESGAAVPSRSRSSPRSPSAAATWRSASASVVGVLRAHDRIFAFEQEARHAGDAHARGGGDLVRTASRRRRSAAASRPPRRPCRPRAPPRPARHGRRYCAPSSKFSWNRRATSRSARRAGGARPADQAMRVERVGRRP